VYALATSAGPRLAGAFMRNVQTRLTSPTSGSSNTSSTVTLRAVALDPFRRSLAVSFQLDRSGAFGSPSQQTSANVNGTGWADTPIAWASTAISNGQWWYRARAVSVAIGAGPGVTSRYAGAVGFLQAGGAGITRSLYVYVNKGIWATTVEARSLYVYVNKGIYPGVLSILSRSLYLYVNEGFVSVLASRSLYLYENVRDGEVFPFLNHLSPEEQYVGGQVDLFGDGFGQYLDARASATLTVSSTNGGNVADFVRDGSSAEWQSTSGAAAWIRFTWGAAKRIVAIVLEGSRLGGTEWGVPLFRFDDASSQNGGVAVPAPVLPAGSSAEYPVGGERVVYWLATPKVSTYVEVAIASGGGGTNRGLSEAWVIEEIVPAQAAETARAVLNLGLLTEQNMGIVAWQNRSPNLYPANSGVALGPAATVTVPTGAVSGLVHVEEST